VASPNAEHCETLGMQNVSEYLERCDTEFMKVGLRGISLLASSQDNGAPGFANVDCAADKQATGGGATASGVMALNPVYPASSPYITAVGATALHQPQKLTQPESVLCGAVECASGGVEEVPAMGAVNSDFTSGGGFSNYEKQPSWQKEAVSQYLSSGAIRPPSALFKAQNRAYPDVSVLGDRIFMVRRNQSMLSGGTSASTPIFAGMISLVNAARAQVGKASLGFLNPLLYQASKASPSVFNDVTTGNNSCTVSLFAPRCCQFGYGASKGWDPVSGWFASRTHVSPTASPHIHLTHCVALLFVCPSYNECLRARDPPICGAPEVCSRSAVSAPIKSIVPAWCCMH
jgi:tripeptidyl-peptidase-1